MQGLGTPKPAAGAWSAAGGPCGGVASSVKLARLWAISVRTALPYETNMENPWESLGGHSDVGGVFVHLSSHTV